MNHAATAVNAKLCGKDYREVCAPKVVSQLAECYLKLRHSQTQLRMYINSRLVASPNSITNVCNEHTLVKC